MIQILIVFLAISCILVYGINYLRFFKLYRLYNKETIAKNRATSQGRMNPFLPQQKSSRYQAAQRLLVGAGSKISIEQFYTIKLLICILGTTLFVGIYITNMDFLIKDIVINPNFGKNAMDSYVEVTHKSTENEKVVFQAVGNAIKQSGMKQAELFDKNNKELVLEFINNYIISSKYESADNASEIARRIYEKLIKISKINNSAANVVNIIIAALVLYSIPEIIIRLKIRLIEDKKDWEILNCTYVYSIFGKLPPYNVKTILENMIVVVEIFKPQVSELLESLKAGRGEGAFDEVLEKIENQDMFEMFETMKLSVTTGILNTVDMIDENADNQLKWLEIKGIKRRKAKQLFAMIPVVIVMLLGAVYFSYSLSILSNPSSFVK